MPTNIDIVDELREKQSRDNRALLDRAADEIENLRDTVDELQASLRDAREKLVELFGI